MALEQLSNEQLKEYAEHTSVLAEFWSGPLGDALRTEMVNLTEMYMREIMDGDAHAFRAVRAMNDLAKQLGDQALYNRAVRVEFERRYNMNGGRR